MSQVEQLITDNLDVWTSAIQKRGSQGRGSSKKIELYGIKKLRELILELAVRGLLVPQDPNDEPACVLLEKIAAEKERLVKEGKIKKPKKLTTISGEEKPFNLPFGWTWCRLGEIGLTQTGGTPKKSDQDHYGSFMPFIKPGDINDGVIVSYENDGLSDVGAQSLGRIAPADSVLMVCIGTIGKCARVDRGVAFNQQINSISPYLEIGGYISKVLQAPFFQSSAWHFSSSTTLSILNKGKWEQIPIPVAPEPEQPRIVAKVDELMALCDQLELQTEDSLSAHQTLVETLLNALLDAAQSHDDSSSKESAFDQAWQRIAEHFDVLFTTDHSIDQLKQTILQLAVMGKLVPQDPNDEPASVLLEKIATEKKRLVKEGKIKKQKPLPPIGEDEKPFELPVGWEWVRFDDIVDIGSGVTKGRKLGGRETVEVPYLSVANVQRGYLVLDEIKCIEIGVEEQDKYQVKNGDLLITEGGDWDKVGRTAIWRNEIKYMAHQNHVFKARPLIEELNEVWLEKYLNSQPSRDYFAGSSKQTTNLASINKTQLRGCLIALPPLSESDRIVKWLDELIKLCDNLKASIRKSQITQFCLADVMTEQALPV